MTIINPNSIAGITSVTAQADIINFYKSNGTPGSLQIDGCNFNTTNGISTFNNLVVGGTLTYEDVKNVDSVGIITARGGLNVTANTDTDTLNVSGISTFGGVLKIPTVAGTNTNSALNVLFQTGTGVIDGGSALTYNPSQDVLSVNGNHISINTFRGSGDLGTLTCSNHSSTTFVSVSSKVDIGLKDNTAGAFNIKEGSNEYITIDTTNSSELIKFGTAGSERLRIGSNGEILTGGATSEPLYPAYTTARKVQAEIKGGIDVGQTRHHGSLAINCTNENATLHLIRSQANNTSGLDAGVIGFTVYDGTDFHQCARIMASRDATGGDNDTPGRLTFHTTPDGTSSAIERLRINSSGHMTLSPSGYSLPTGDQRTLNIVAWGNKAASLGFQRSSSLGGSTCGWSNELQSNGDLIWGVHNVGEKLRITAAGRLGLGVTPEAFHANSKSVIRGGGGYAILGRSDNQVNFSQNFYYDSSDAGKYIANGEASLYTQIDGVHKFYSAASGSANASASQVEKFRIEASGRLLYGNHRNDRGAELQYEGSQHAGIGIHRNTADHGAPAMMFSASRGTSAGSNTIVQSGDYLGMLNFKGADGSDLASGAYITAIVDGTPGNNDMPARLGLWTSADGSQSPDERMRIDKDGFVYCNTTSQGPHGSFFNIKATDKSTNGLGVQGTTANYAIISSAGGSTGDHIYFSNWSNSNTNTGRIKDNSSNVTYHTSSDYRLKDNIVSISDGITRVKQLNPVRHTWKTNPALGTVDGWIAHELDAICPDAVDGVKDAVKDDGSIDPQAVDYGRITPLLAAALKEAIAKIETLETKVAALESS